jgi:hypothetical protein
MPQLGDFIPLSIGQTGEYDGAKPISVANKLCNTGASQKSKVGLPQLGECTLLEGHLQKAFCKC